MKTLQIPAVIILFACALFMVYPPFWGSGKVGSSPGPRANFRAQLDTPHYAVVERRMDEKTAALAELNKKNLQLSKAISNSVDSLQRGLSNPAVINSSPEELQLLDTLPVPAIRIVKK